MTVGAQLNRGLGRFNHNTLTPEEKAHVSRVIAELGTYKAAKVLRTTPTTLDKLLCTGATLTARDKVRESLRAIAGGCDAR